MDEAAFQRARDVLVTDIVQVGCSACTCAHARFRDRVFWVCRVLNHTRVQELGEVVSNMNTLNRNLESLVEVGRDIERVSDVWLSFHGKVSVQ